MPRDAGRTLTERFDRALGAVVKAAPDAFKHTELDVPANTRQLELLCERVEKLAAKTAAATQPAESPLTVLAHQLREALAANTIGGRADDESKWKSAEYEARAAQDAWRQVGFVPEAGRRGAHGAVPESVAAVLQLAPRTFRPWRSEGSTTDVEVDGAARSRSSQVRGVMRRSPCPIEPMRPIPTHADALVPVVLRLVRPVH